MTKLNYLQLSNEYRLKQRFQALCDKAINTPSHILDNLDSMQEECYFLNIEYEQRFIKEKLKLAAPLSISLLLT